MRPEERDPAYLWDMIEAARAIVDFTKNLTLEEFLAAGRDREIHHLQKQPKLTSTLPGSKMRRWGFQKIAMRNL
jgi:hypothetical protein